MVSVFEVHFHDTELGVDDFESIRAESAQAARDQFEESREEAYEVKEVVEAYEIDLDAVEELTD